MNEIKLDEKQQSIVEMGDGRYSIRAGAGSGKSFCLLKRVEKLVNDGVKPNDILCLTFTSNAAKNMRERACDNAKEVEYRTIHSYQLEILRNELWRYNRSMSPFQVVSGMKRKIMLKKAMEEIDIDENIDIGTVSLAIGRCKGLERDSTGDSEIDEVMLSYELEKKKNKLVDFDDFAPMTNKLLEDNQSLQKRYGKKHILVDEAHDTSVAQHKTIELLEQGNLFLISSVEQCCYSWRCASPELIVNIDTKYPDIKIIDLETNYRSTDNIIKSANSLIRNAKWKSLQMKGTGRNSNNGNGVSYANHFDCLGDEADYIANHIVDDSTAILYRTNWYSLSIELALRKLGIQYQILGSRSFFDLADIADLVSYIRLAINANDKEAFLRVFNRPNRYFGNKWLAECEMKLEDMSIDEMLSSNFSTADGREYNYWGKNQRKLLEQLAILRCLQQPQIIIAYIREAIGYDEWLKKEKLGNEADDDLEIYANLDALETLARNYDNANDFLNECLNYNGVYDTGISIGTFHSVKGLEYDNVYIAGVTNNLLPHFRSYDKEEERRLLYVGITRARDNVTMSSAFHKQFNSPSYFLNEIDY
jgi:DNA helicase-2/ATP-dependent DNA helicase PcrA